MSCSFLHPKGICDIVEKSVDSQPNIRFTTEVESTFNL